MDTIRPFFYAHIAYYFTSHRGILSTGYEACLAKAVAELLLRDLQVSISAVYPDTQGHVYGAAVFFVTLYFGRTQEGLDTCAALREDEHCGGEDEGNVSFHTNCFFGFADGSAQTSFMK